MEMLREELGPVLAGMHVPLVKGGVQLHKLQGVMHDTCNTANKTARLAKALRDTSGQLHYGYDNWELLAEDDKPWFDFLCGNHTRNLPMDAFNKVTNPNLYPNPYPNPHPNPHPNPKPNQNPHPNPNP
jgi:hypothetical protein